MPRPNAAVVNPGLYEHLRASGRYGQALTIRRPTRARSASGARSVTGSVLIYNAIPAQIAVRSGGEIRRKDDTIIQQAFMAELPGVYEQIRETDTATDAAGGVYDIISIDNASADGRTRLTLEQVS